VLGAAVLGARGIGVNAVAPEVVDTDMSNFTKVTLGFPGAGELANPKTSPTVAFLASARARWITGASILVDGRSKL